MSEKFTCSYCGMELESANVFHDVGSCARYMRGRIAELDEQVSALNEYNDGAIGEIDALNATIENFKNELQIGRENGTNIESRIAELEKSRALHANLNKKVAKALGLKVYRDSWHDLPEKVVALNRRIAELEAAQRWIPVTEKLPEDDVEVIGYFDNGKYWWQAIVAYYKKEKVWTADNHVLRRGAITHWMPLPEPPEERDS